MKNSQFLSFPLEHGGRENEPLDTNQQHVHLLALVPIQNVNDLNSQVWTPVHVQDQFISPENLCPWASPGEWEHIPTEEKRVREQGATGFSKQSELGVGWGAEDI